MASFKTSLETFNFDLSNTLLNLDDDDDGLENIPINYFHYGLNLFLKYKATLL